MVQIVQKKTNDEQTIWIVQRNKKKYRFVKTNENKKKTNNLKSFERIWKKTIGFYRTNEFSKIV